MDYLKQALRFFRRKERLPSYSSTEKLSHEDYTIGWIAVLSCELNAARVLLDEEHENIPHPPGDTSSYIYGRMGEHNVVIAFPGVGQYGTVAVSITATHLQRSFPNIRCTLLVGIGGGAPGPPDKTDGRNDIHLGDVVVSEPGQGHGGVLQYDIGAQVGISTFHIDSDMNEPPSELLLAVQRLKAAHGAGKGYMNQYIQHGRAKFLQLPGTRGFCFPGPENDHLFTATYAHVGTGECQNCDPKKLERRLPRTSARPTVHYGLIASGNSVIRSAEFRDQLRETHGVLCFEMEAAGLMNYIPSIAIRGICDYSDSHKDKAWQPYAALSAAAYAKDMLHIITPAEVKRIQKD